MLDKDRLKYWDVFIDDNEPVSLCQIIGDYKCEQIAYRVNNELDEDPDFDYMQYVLDTVEDQYYWSEDTFITIKEN